jgi:hypothetical protein
MLVAWSWIVTLPVVPALTTQIDSGGTTRGGYNRTQIRKREG